MAAINDFRIVFAGSIGIGHVIAQFIQRIHDHAEGFAFVVAFEVFDVLQHEDSRTPRFDNARNVEKQRSLRFALKTVGATERILFTYPGEAKRLTGKARQQHVVLGDLLFDMGVSLGFRDGRIAAQRHFADILIKGVRGLIVVPVGFIGAHRVFCSIHW